MPVITKISVNKTLPNCYDIFFDNGEGMNSVTIHKNTFVRFGISKGMELDVERLQKIVFEDEVQKGFDRAAIYLSYSMRSIKQVEKDLLEKGFPPIVAEVVIDRLKEKGYVNDREFARSFVRTQLKTTDKGPLHIKKLLRDKGIDEKTIEEEIVLYSLEMQREKALYLTEKWLKKKKGLSVSLLKVELYSMLKRKGFEERVIREAIDEIVQSLDDGHNLEAIKRQGEKAVRKYRNSPPEIRKMKIKQYLFRKGFSVDLIHQYVEQLDEIEGMDGKDEW
ncbi:RecX family transcriptional regulator [Fervidibacillus albus]|uniref:Regulatory protein RecX n=1 Tax=Fervidibacillus albus TaxID=2980026 RepID=A0A9E8RU38_9BACI|nr:RecX family transcriptional regulator [Fervidibacillus albus]WAA08790.1 RecX family transcriptional regulator [Fervidibacillus albus]